MANSTHTIKVNVNGQTVSADISSELRLLDFLRYELDLTGAKEVCGEGECGACTVVLDGITVNSCLVLAVEVDGAEITTIEGLSKNGTLNEMQKAFVDHHSVQCGYCIPGMVLSGVTRSRDDGIISETITNPIPPKKNRHTEISGPVIVELLEIILAMNSELA